MTNEELVELYQNGDKQALNKLIEKNIGIVYKLVNKFYVEGTNSIDKEDLEQEGFLGLIAAADKYKFDIENRAKFITYAVYWIYQKIQRFINSRNTNTETSLNLPIWEDGETELLDYIEDVDYGFENVEKKLYSQQLRKELDQVMRERLTLKEREILKLHYGWDKNKIMNPGEIGSLFKCTSSSIRNNESIALGKIRRSPWGVRKAKELAINKCSSSFKSIHKRLDYLDWENKYLKDSEFDKWCKEYIEKYNMEASVNH